MKFQQNLSKLLFILLLSLVSANVMAETKWEVAAIFLGHDEDAEFQKSVDENLKEIAQVQSVKSLIVKTYREEPSKNVDRKKLSQFIKNSFKDATSKKMIVFYGHGIGPLGMKDFPVTEMKRMLTDLKIKFDIAWFDACFLSNLEFLYEMKNFSTYSIASEEAEFSTGLPFETLGELTAISTAKEASVMLAKNFIESYSYIKNGQQRDAVGSSSATITVVDNQELSNFAQTFKKVSAIIKNLPADVQSALKSRLSQKFSMDQKELVDLGHLLIELRLISKNSAVDQELTKLIRMMNIDSVKKLKTNPRIKITAPEAGAIMVFGFNHWENGFKTEYQENPLFAEILKSDKFIEGPAKNQWPVKKFNYASTTITPFAPGVNSFDYYFLDAKGSKLLTEALSIKRTHDVVETSGGMLLYSAYTQRVGVKAERYTGINITVFNTIPSMDYFEMEFNQMASWLSL